MFGVFPYWNARKSFASQIHFREPISYTFNPEGVSGKGQSASWGLAWHMIKHVRETKSLFLLYHNRRMAVTVPKRFFTSDAEMANWRRQVAAWGSPKQIEAAGVVGRFC
jgi:hypothetical protein